MASVLAASVLLMSLSAALALPATPRICYGDSNRPVVYGEVSLVADGWGWNPAVVVATIHDGTLQPRQDVKLPADFRYAYDYRLIVGIGPFAAPPSSAVQTEWAYGNSLPPTRPDYLKRFTAVYLSMALAKNGRGENWQAALQSLGRTIAGTLVLPLPRQRSVRLLYPDGRPLRNAVVDIEVYASRYSHCGGAGGLPVGEFTTDEHGHISIIATAGPLALSRSYWIPRPGGPAGAAYELDDSLVTSSANDVTVAKLWELPEYDYLVTLRTPGGKPLPGVHLYGCLWSLPCGAGCGPVPRYAPPLSDSSGQLRFREQDLRANGQITAVDPAGHERPLTTTELKALFTSHRVTIVWK